MSSETEGPWTFGWTPREAAWCPCGQRGPRPGAGTGPSTGDEVSTAPSPLARDALPCRTVMPPPPRPSTALQLSGPR